MKFYKSVLRFIMVLLIITVITLIICVIGLNTEKDAVPVLGSFAEKPAVSNDRDRMIPPDLKPSEDISRKEVIEPSIEEGIEKEGPDPGSDGFVPAEEQENEMPRIVCFGDSLTESTDEETAYPDVLRRISGAEVINYGIRSDTTVMIAARAGSVGLYTDEFVIPAGPDPVNISIHTESGNKLPLLRYGDNGINPCYINGIKGRLSRTGGTYFFTRDTEGDPTAVPEGSRITTGAMAAKNSGDILVLFTGTNDRPDRKSIQDIISLQRGIIEYTGCDKYVVIGLTCKKVIPDIVAVNEALSAEYGDNFLDIRSFMLENGLVYEGLRETPEDSNDIINGEIPSGLRIDYVHGNRYFYDIIANMLYEKLRYLGYLPSEEEGS
ncbi:MAG: hypothetical protein K5770_15705 [Lachnospiraceae bacterium]|nr:hypothetical protein [Lachnospiraceae bacterium]